MAAQQKARGVWDGLNERQRVYLATIYDLDQAAEASITARRRRWEQVPPASEWRQITYDIKVPKDHRGGYTTVQNTLRTAGQHDTGSGSSLAALERRGLVEVTHDRVQVPMLGLVPRVRVRLTSTGRAAARAGKGETGPARAPRGLMTRGLWGVLVRLYTAGEAGLANDWTPDKTDRAPSWNTLLYLRDRRDGSLIEEYSAAGTHRGVEFRQARVRISDQGRYHYGLHVACYRETYPDIDAPLPATVPAHAHRGLADHTAPKPRHLLREPDFRVLATLARCELHGVCYLRHVLEQEHQRLGRPVPDEVAAIPPGLLHWQIREVAGTDKATERLAAHRGGALVEVIDAPNPRLTGRAGAPATLDLVCLTDTGRAHYHQHQREYQALYPEAASAIETRPAPVV